MFELSRFFFFMFSFTNYFLGLVGSWFILEFMNFLYDHGARDILLDMFRLPLHASEENVSAFLKLVKYTSVAHSDNFILWSNMVFRSIQVNNDIRLVSVLKVDLYTLEARAFKGFDNEDFRNRNCYRFLPSLLHVLCV
jgi:hypothetical protein